MMNIFLKECEHITVLRIEKLLNLLTRHAASFCVWFSCIWSLTGFLVRYTGFQLSIESNTKLPWFYFTNMLSGWLQKTLATYVYSTNQM